MKQNTREIIQCKLISNLKNSTTGKGFIKIKTHFTDSVGFEGLTF